MIAHNENIFNATELYYLNKYINIYIYMAKMIN